MLEDMLEFEDILTALQHCQGEAVTQYHTGTLFGNAALLTSAAQQASLMFPRPGEKVTLYLSKHLETAGPYSMTVHVDSGRQKAKFSPIARLLVTVLRL